MGQADAPAEFEAALFEDGRGCRRMRLGVFLSILRCDGRHDGGLMPREMSTE